MSQEVEEFHEVEDRPRRRWLGLQYECCWGPGQTHWHWFGSWYYDIGFWIDQRWKWVRHPLDSWKMRRWWKSLPSKYPEARG